jgi:hypothetical protein
MAKKAPAKPPKKKTTSKKTAAPRKKAASPKKAVKKATPKKVAPKTPARKTPVPKTLRKAADGELDLRAFPAESIESKTIGLCLACALDVLTRHMGLSPDRAMTEIRKYSPRLDELSATSLARPYLEWPADECPFCGAPKKWHAPLTILRIEGGKASDAARRALLKEIGESAKFAIIEEKSTQRDALYSWLLKTGENLDLDSSGWLLDATLHWLGRRLPKEDWSEIFKYIRYVKRSRRLDDGFEVANPVLYLAPMLFDEVLLIQYLLSRSHKAGGLTFEGRLTLQDLFYRLRRGGYLKHAGITAGNPADALEQLLEMQGGEGRLKFHYIVDRRELLSRLAALKDARIPRPSSGTRRV